MTRHQVPLSLGALALGAGAGFLPGVPHVAEPAITPILGLLLYATFLGVPFARIGLALRDGRFLLAVLVVNFVIAPLVVLALSRIVAHDRVILIGVLFVLLTPCVDYVIVFTGLAGGAKERLLAAAPLLMLAQLVLLPLLLWLFAGAEFAAAVDLAPFAEAFVLLIALPLAAAALTQAIAARARRGEAVSALAERAGVPLTMLTLAVVVASQIARVGERFGSVLLAVPVCVLFAAVMIPVGLLASRVARLDAPGRRAIVFSGVTRNSLVVLPLVLALPAAYDLAPVVVVTQTIVELILMVVLVRLVPRLVPARAGAGHP